MLSDSSKDTRFAGNLIVGAAALVLTIAAAWWSWFWSTFPVNDGLGVQWSEAQWRNAANAALWRGVLRATVVALTILGTSVVVRRGGGSPTRRVSILLALCAAAIIVVVTWYGSRMFIAQRPLW